MSSNLDVGPFSNNIAVFQDQQSNGVAGTAITTTLTDQTLNTEVIAKSWASLSANQVTLDAGDYSITVTDHFKGSSVDRVMVYYIRSAANAIIDSGQSAFPEAITEDLPVNINMTISLSVSTAIKLSVQALFTGATRTAYSAGTEYYQKLIIQKIG
jgi:hypothetical protein